MLKFIKKNILSILSLGLLCSFVVNPVLVKANSLDEAQQKKQQIQNSIDEANKLVNSLKTSKDTTENKINSIDKQILALEKENTKVEKSLKKADADIENLSTEMEKTKETLDEKMSDMSIRIVYSYENGRNNLINALFTSKDIGEFLNVINYSVEIAKYDKEVLDEYEQALQVFSQQKDALAQKQEDAKRLKEENDDRLSAINALKDAKEAELGDIDGELTDAKAIAKAYEQEMQAQNEVLAAIVAAQAAKDQESQQTESVPEEEGSNDSANNTPSTEQSVQGFTWPCPASRRITSEYGLRESPTAGASTNHRGIDIGAPRGSSIVAAASGKVILSTYSSSAGNYIIIDHGKNSAGKTVCSVYMHADTRLVSVGAVVSKGQQIATVGSTGVSTGPHLHFGVTENGTYVNPWGYL